MIREGRETQTYRERFEDGRPICQELAISTEFWGDVLPLKTSVFGEDPVPTGPTDDREIDDAEFLSKEVRPADLVGVTLEIFDPFVQGGGLKLSGLGVEEAEVARYDELVDEVDPDPGLSGDVRIGGYQAGLVLRVGSFEELEDDVRVVKRPSLVREGGD